MPLTEQLKEIATNAAASLGYGMTPGMLEVIERFLAALPKTEPVAVYEEVLSGHRRLVRKLDVLLNGEEGAAQQASLCDLVAQVEREGIKAQPASKQKPVGRGWIDPSTGKLVCAAPDGPVFLYAGPIKPDFKASTEEEGDAFTHGYFAGLEDSCGTPPATPDKVAGLTSAASDVLTERQRQQEVEGWTLEHDDQHNDGEIARAAGCYALSGSGKWSKEALWNIWPRKDWSVLWFKTTDTRRDLVKSGALILAEIERLDRAALAAVKDK